ncbi:MAG: membrane protein insertion efficiency factor YidD [Ruminococcaceae bacterium]|nr:membrane protein insertion efficiency factor YidD [Oscillospiraceae bacterium]
MIEIFLLPVKVYRRFLSPMKIYGSCRFRPTCSQYCIEAIREWGIIVGTLLTVWRLLRCNPFSKGGYDPVPKRKKK